MVAVTRAGAPPPSAPAGAATTAVVPAQTPRAKPAALDRRAGHLARRLVQGVSLLWAATVSEDVTSVQFCVLNVLAGSPGIDQRTLGELASTDRSTVAEVVERLARKGYVDCVRDSADRRRKLLRLSPAGAEAHAGLVERTAAMNRILLAPLDLDEQEVFIKLFQRLVESLERLRARP